MNENKYCNAFEVSLFPLNYTNCINRKISDLLKAPTSHLLRGNMQLDARGLSIGHLWLCAETGARENLNFITNRKAPT